MDCVHVCFVDVLILKAMHTFQHVIGRVPAVVVMELISVRNVHQDIDYKMIHVQVSCYTVIQTRWEFDYN